MLKLDTRHVFSLGDEANLEFCLQIGVILPVGVDVPGKQEARRWFPQEDRTPVASAAIFAPFVPKAPDAWLDDRVHCVHFADLVVPDNRMKFCTACLSGQMAALGHKQTFRSAMVMSA